MNLNIENLIQENIEVRKLHGIKERSQFNQIVNELYNSKCVGIITGFPVYSKNIGETDGPLGAMSIAYSLRALGKEIFIITDKYSFKMIESLKKLLEIDIKIYDADLNRSEIKNIVSTGKISHLVAIERPGKSKDGNYYSMGGININNLVSDTDEIFKMAMENGVITISIGDGGNELGFGNIREYVEDNVYKGDLIAANLKSDYILICGISNWGGYGIAKGIEIISGKKIIYDEKTEEVLLDDMVKNGGVDGCTGKNEASVDGKQKEEYLKIIEEIYCIK